MKSIISLVHPFAFRFLSENLPIDGVGAGSTLVSLEQVLDYLPGWLCKVLWLLVFLLITLIQYFEDLFPEDIFPHSAFEMASDYAKQKLVGENVATYPGWPEIPWVLLAIFLGYLVAENQKEWVSLLIGSNE